MAELVESGFLGTSVTVDYDSRNLEAVKKTLLEGWNYLLTSEPQPVKPKGYKFIFRDPTGQPYALVSEYQAEVNHPINHSEQRVAEIYGGVLSSPGLRVNEVVIVQETPLYVYPADQKIDLEGTLREMSSSLTEPFSEEVENEVRRNRLNYLFHIGSGVYVLSLRGNAGPPARVECSLRGHYEGFKTEESLEENLLAQGELLKRLTPSIQQAAANAT